MKSYSSVKQAALYARISIQEKEQDPEMQLRELRTYALQRGFTIREEFVDYASGATDARPRYKALLEAVQKRKVDVVIVWRYDRFALSTQALVNTLKEFHGLGVDFISYQENIDTTIPTGELIFHVMASLAHFESSMISERVKVGMAKAKAMGKPIARPALPVELQRQIIELHRQGISLNKISKQLGIAYGTVYNYARKSKQ